MQPPDFHSHPAYTLALQQAGLASAEDFFASPLVRPWRDIGERDNATLDLPSADGSLRRLHVKRYRTGSPAAARSEVEALRALHEKGIPTFELAAWGWNDAGQSFTAAIDLAGYQPADKALFAGAVTFDGLLTHTARLAAQLHAAGLHHQDLYLCHFFVRAADLDLRLIDVSRVRRLPPWPLRRRWVVKDLGQFAYSTLVHGVTDAQRAAWLAAYWRLSGNHAEKWAGAVGRKVARIARHDAKLKVAQPMRNVSIPPTPQVPEL